MAESAVQAKGRLRAIERGAYLVNQWGTAISGSGVPDQLLCYRGFFVALEWKNPRLKLVRELVTDNDKFATDEQRLHLAAIRKAGGLGWVVNSVWHVDAALSFIDVCAAAKRILNV